MTPDFWSGFIAGIIATFVLSFFGGVALVHLFGLRGEIDRRHPPANRLRSSTSDPQWYVQNHDTDRSIIRLDDHRRGTTQTPERGRGA